MVLTGIFKNGYQQIITFVPLIKKRILPDTFVKNYLQQKAKSKMSKTGQRRVSQLPRGEKDTLFFATFGE